MEKSYTKQLMDLFAGIHNNYVIGCHSIEQNSVQLMFNKYSFMEKTIIYFCKYTLIFIDSRLLTL